MAAEPLSTQLSIAINNSFRYNIFPSNAEVACVKLLDKKTEDKHPILNTFSKIYEKFAKNVLVPNIQGVSKKRPPTLLDTGCFTKKATQTFTAYISK